MERRPHHSTAPSHHRCLGTAGASQHSRQSAARRLYRAQAPLAEAERTRQLRPPAHTATPQGLHTLSPERRLRHRAIGRRRHFALRHQASPLVAADVTGIRSGCRHPAPRRGVNRDFRCGYAQRRFRTRYTRRASLSLAAARTTQPAPWVAAQQTAA